VDIKDHLKLAQLGIACWADADYKVVKLLKSLGVSVDEVKIKVHHPDVELFIDLGHPDEMEVSIAAHVLEGITGSLVQIGGDGHTVTAFFDPSDI